MHLFFFSSLVSFVQYCLLALFLFFLSCIKHTTSDLLANLFSDLYTIYKALSVSFSDYILGQIFNISLWRYKNMNIRHLTSKYLSLV